MAPESGSVAEPVTQLPGVGGRLAERLAKVGIRDVQDLLFHLPLRYEDRTTVVPMGRLRAGAHVLVEGRIDAAEVVSGKRRRFMCRLSDGTGRLTLQFFHFFPGQVNQLRAGQYVQCFGEVRPGPVALQMVHPEYRLVEPGESNGGSSALTAVYPTTQGLGQAVIRRLVDEALSRLNGLEDWLPDDLVTELRLPSLSEALEYVHRPPAGAPVESLLEGEHASVRRLAFEELLAHHLSLRSLRTAVQSRCRAPVLRSADRLTSRFLSDLPFNLTAAQSRVNAEIASDMASSKPMLRLVQGDVGSGKTVVAALGAVRTVECGWQAAVMAPTELLAEQHYRNFRQWLKPLGIEVVWLTGRLNSKQRHREIDRLAHGHGHVAVGTHALFQESVTFFRLGLVIVDEQHRFGVHQRLALREKGASEGAQPHQLIMTATPIPRTLAMTAYADLDVSVIDELPPGRTPVNTVVVPDSRRADVVARVARACEAGRQAYWVCTLIEESEALQAEAAEDTVERLQEALPGLRIGLVHGRLKSVEKERIMAAFAAGDLNLLVATTVIEVGVDVPNASLMIIENAERLGLAQLHQLRGRVGRGRRESSCVLMYRAPLSASARSRLAVLRDTGDGFRIANEDLRLRGPGEFLGTRQTGDLNYRIADLTRDGELLASVRRTADRLLARKERRAVSGLIRRWVGEAARYGQV